MVRFPLPCFKRLKGLLREITKAFSERFPVPAERGLEDLVTSLTSASTFWAWETSKMRGPKKMIKINFFFFLFQFKNSHTRRINSPDVASHLKAIISVFSWQISEGQKLSSQCKTLWSLSFFLVNVIIRAERWYLQGTLPFSRSLKVSPIFLISS